MHSHTIKNVSILGEGRLNFINKEENMKAKSVGKNLSDYLDDGTEEANRSEVIDHENTFFFRNKSNQFITKARIFTLPL